MERDECAINDGEHDRGCGGGMSIAIYKYVVDNYLDDYVDDGVDADDASD